MEPAPQREESLFQAAAQLNGPQRAAFLNEACHGDPALHHRLEARLAAQDDQNPFSEPREPKPAPELLKTIKLEVPAELGDEGIGHTLGRYKLLEQIGEGGCGVVYVAEQEQPVHRRVALKIIKLGMDTKQVIARFEAERQALALMDHPNIAKVFDGGATAGGRPFFVMELVKGVRITDYCDRNNLSTAERLDLFIQVCQAIQHAHQKGIIHRDIKPSNILVTLQDGKPVPKVIDFGIAKATTDLRLTDKTLYTAVEQFIGTPAYMSPEQVELSGLDIDTRSDIYALGVLLYELLTGKTPFDAHRLIQAGLDEIRRIIREEEPPRPSTKLSGLTVDEQTTTAKRRQTDPPKLVHLVRGDLDWIVMKTLEKDRTRRYETASGLALDIQHYLNSEPVMARPPGQYYRFRKLVRRNKLVFAASAAVATALLFGIIASTWQSVRATRAEKRAVAAFDELRATAPAFAEQARALAAKEHFDEAIEKLDYAVKLRPDMVEFLVAKGDLLQCQLKLAEAAAIYREALIVQPGLARAEASAKLCDDLLAANPNADGKLTRESLAKLHLAMQQQQRPAAELMPVARLLGEEKKLIVEYWLARLKDLPISADNPLAKRLTVRDDGRLALDLSYTKVTDLSPLSGAPLAALDVSKSSDLTDLSPLRALDLIELNLSGTSVADLTSLRDMHALEKLDVSDSKVSDLAALGALRLKNLKFLDCAVSDLNPIRKMPLEEIALKGTRVTDISPLIGMPIKSIDLSFAPVLDFSPLAKLPLEKCYLQRNRITDLAVLRDRPLKELVLWACADARNYAAIAEIKTLELLLLPSEYRDLPEDDYTAIGSLRNHPRLRQLGSEIMDQMRYAETGSKDIFWQDWDREQSFVPALRKSRFRFSLQMLPTKTYALWIQDQPLIELSMLKGAPISELYLDRCQVTDLTPIHDLKLEVLHLSGDPVGDLSPLRGMPLKNLVLADSKISDLSSLKGLPLRDLYLDGCKSVTNVAALAEIPTLEKVTVPMQARNIEALRKLPKLQLLALNRSGNDLLPNSTADEFWKDYGWISRLRDSGFKPNALRRLDDGTWEVGLEKSSFTDFSILSGAPISSLSLAQTAVTNLESLRGMALKSLQLHHTKVTDLSPLKGMQLELLHLAATEVTNISVLRGMPLQRLWLDGCDELIDLSALADCKELREISLPSNAKNIEFLRAFPKIEQIDFVDITFSHKTAEQFWSEYGQPWAIALRDAGIKYTATQIAEATTSTIATNVAPDSKAKNKMATTAPAGKPMVMWAVAINSKDFSNCSIFKGADNISELDLRGTTVADLQPLRGLALTKLSLDSTKVTGLGPLEGMPIRELNLAKTKVADLSALRGLPLKNIDLGNTAVADLEPLRGMALQQLHLSNTKVTDLRPIEGMPLEDLGLQGTKVTDLSVLRGMPLTNLRFNNCSELANLSPLADCRQLEQLTLPPNAKGIDFLRTLPKLERLSFQTQSDRITPDKTAAEFWREYDAHGWLRALSNTNLRPKSLKQLDDGTWEVDLDNSAITDLKILSGAPISRLALAGTAVSDLSPLRGMALKQLTLSATLVSDLSPLKGMPLRELYLDHCRSVTDVAVLAEIPTLEKVTVPPEARNIKALRKLAKLQILVFSRTIPAFTVEEFWKDYGWISQLSDAGFKPRSLKQLDDGTWMVDIGKSAIIDLKILNGAPISELALAGTAVSNLAPLRGMVLKRLWLYNTKVTDLSPLKGMPIEFLHLAGTKVTDLSALHGMPLTSILLHDCPALTDLSPLTDLKELKDITLPSNAKNIEFLRDLPKLERIGFKDDKEFRPNQTAAEFWRDYDHAKQPKVAQ